MASARPNASFTVFDQGAGRVDVARAIEQEIVTTPASISLGLQPFPHEDDEVLTREVTYANLGQVAVELELALDVTGPDGLPAPAGMFEVAPASVTVPAGGEVAVTLTADTRVPGALGVYSGGLVATGDGASVRTPLAVDKEAERYNLTIEHLDRRGMVPVTYTTFVQGVENLTGGVPHFDPDGTITLRLPAGPYHLFSVIHTPAGEVVDLSALAQPLLELDRDTEASLRCPRGQADAGARPRALGGICGRRRPLRAEGSGRLRAARRPGLAEPRASLHRPPGSRRFGK